MIFCSSNSVLFIFVLLNAVAAAAVVACLLHLNLYLVANDVHVTDFVCFESYNFRSINDISTLGAYNFAKCRWSVCVKRQPTSNAPENGTTNWMRKNEMEKEKKNENLSSMVIAMGGQCMYVCVCDCACKYTAYALSIENNFLYRSYRSCG